MTTPEPVYLGVDLGIPGTTVVAMRVPDGHLMTFDASTQNRVREAERTWRRFIRRLGTWHARQEKRAAKGRGRRSPQAKAHRRRVERWW